MARALSKCKAGEYSKDRVGCDTMEQEQEQEGSSRTVQSLRQFRPSSTRPEPVADAWLRPSIQASVKSNSIKMFRLNYIQ